MPKQKKNGVGKIKTDIAIYLLVLSLIAASAILLQGSIYLSPIILLELLCLLGCFFALRFGKREKLL